MASETVPFLDFGPMHTRLKDRFTEVFESAVEESKFIGGPMLERFETAFANAVGTKHALGVSSGTDALRFALQSLGVGPGDIAITVPNTFIATAEAITQTGAEVDFVDIDPNTYQISVSELQKYLTQQCFFDEKQQVTRHKATGLRVAAVVPVHLYGCPAPMDDIIEVAQKNELRVVEDACQAHGAQYFSLRLGRWIQAGALGDAAAFSFYPGKNLGCFGEGGAVTTNDDEVARKVKLLRDHGQPRKYVHDLVGYNGRLDAIQAGILSVKLPYLTIWNEERRVHAKLYATLLDNLDHIQLPIEPDRTLPVYHLYVVRVKRRDALQKFLSGEGVQSGLHYPVPIHLQPAYLHLGKHQGDYPVAELASREIISLPMFPGISDAQQLRVAEVIGSFVQQGKPASVGAGA